MTPDDPLIPPNEQILLDMINETRPPANAYEQQLLEEIRALKAKGRIIDIPSNGI